VCVCVLYVFVSVVHAANARLNVFVHGTDVYVFV